MDIELEKVSRILNGTAVIAVVGASTNPEKSACTVTRYMQEVGYRIIPVNPNAVEGTILGERVYRQLGDVSEAVDMVQVFRPSEEVPAIVDSAIEMGAKFVWMQSGIVHEGAAAKAETAGLEVVMDVCARVCHRLLVNSGGMVVSER